jgi:hypothetical protein
MADQGRGAMIGTEAVPGAAQRLPLAPSPAHLPLRRGRADGSRRLGQGRRHIPTVPTMVAKAVESLVRHTVFRMKPGTVGYDNKQSRCGLPSQHLPLHAGEKKDNMLMLVIHALTIVLWAVAAVAACGIALGFLARTVTGRAPYRNHSRLVAAAIRWEKNWHR